MWGTLSVELQCPPVDDCPAASHDSGVLARGSESTSFYSAILVPSVSLVYKELLLIPPLSQLKSASQMASQRTFYNQLIKEKNILVCFRAPHHKHIAAESANLW